MKDMDQQALEREVIAITTQLLAESGQPYKREVNLADSLPQHLGIDSLGRAELFGRLEKKFHVTFPDRIMAEAVTLDAIVAYLLTAAPGSPTRKSPSIITSHGEKMLVDPSQAKTLVDVLLLYASQTPNKVHLYFQNEEGQEERYTYGDLLQFSLRVANGLIEKGLKPGETVAIMQPTQPGFFYTFLGILLAGGIPVPIYPPFRMHMLEEYARLEGRILSNAEARILVTFENAEKLSHLLKAFVPSLKVVTTVTTLLQASPLSSVYHAKADDSAFIQYTSGSTSDPKGVLLTHFNLLSNIRAYGKAVRATEEDVVVSWLPLYHDFGLIGAWLGSLYHGVPLILMTPFAFLNRPERWLWNIHYHRGTITGAPNFAYELCISKISPEQIEGLDLSSWRIAANGAEKVYPRTLELFAKKFAPYGLQRKTLLPVYGLAESTVGLTIPPLDREFWIDHVDRKKFEEERIAVTTEDKNNLAFVSCGLPIEGHEVRIVDEQGQPLAERVVGNLQFKGPSSMQGYYNNPAATKAIYHQGWLDSGDLAYMAQGEVFITGRLKDLIIKAGRNIYPAEIEELVASVPGVRQGCVSVFGVSELEQRGTEQLIVVAETREQDKRKREDIIKLINETITKALDMVPDRVILVKPHSVPKTSSGKLQRSACKKMYLENRLGRIRLPMWVQAVRLGMQWLMQKSIRLLKLAAKLVYTVYLVSMLMITLFPIYWLVRFSSRQTAAKMVRGWARFLMRVSLCPIKVVDAHKLIQPFPVIYVANHASYVDALVMLSLLPAGTALVGKKELLKMPIVKTFMHKLGFLTVDRVEVPKGLEDTQQIEARLKSGDAVLIFPEGTFGYGQGLRPFRLGAFKVAAETGVPICPIAVSGTRYVLRESEKILCPGRVKITICDLIKPQGNDWQDVTLLRLAVRREIAKYCGEPSLDLITAEAIAPKQRQR